MDLPPDKAKLLRNYDLEKKWEIICDQDMVQAKDSPAHYLNKLRTYLDPKASRSHRVSWACSMTLDYLEFFCKSTTLYSQLIFLMWMFCDLITPEWFERIPNF